MARGPAYPYINLDDAVRLTRKLYDFAKRAPANLNSVLKDKWGYSSTSSSAVKITAALKYYGLIDVAPGAASDQETVRITDRSYRILIDTPNSPERKKALQDACLAPKAYRLCWDTWGASMPDAMRSMLIFTHGFHENTIDGFLANYRKSVVFAGLLEVTPGELHDSERLNDENNAPSLGDFVQWEHDGVLGLPKPLKLVKFSDDRTHAWVDGHATGLPVHELVKIDAPPTLLLPHPPFTHVAAPPHVSPEQRDTMSGTRATAGFTLPAKGIGMRQEIFSLTEGDVTIQWPERISRDSWDDINDWLTILKRKLERSVLPPNQPERPSADLGGKSST